MTDLSRLIVVGTERAEFGVLCEAVTEVVRLQADNMQIPRQAGDGAGQDLVGGVTHDGLILLSGAALLEDKRLFIE